MTDAAPMPDRTTQMLDLLAEMDRAAAQHVHAQLLATTEPAEVATLARAYQRAARGLRQVLMLKMKHEKDRAEAAARVARAAEPSIFDDARCRMADIRTGQLQDAVRRVAAAAWPDKPRLQREALDRLDVLIDDWLADDGEEKLFLDRLDDLVIDACERLDLPLALARQWEGLPAAAQTFDPATTPPPEVPHADTG